MAGPANKARGPAESSPCDVGLLAPAAFNSAQVLPAGTKARSQPRGRHASQSGFRSGQVLHSQDTRRLCMRSGAAATSGTARMRSNCCRPELAGAPDDRLCESARHALGVGYSPPRSVRRSADSGVQATEGSGGQGSGNTPSEKWPTSQRASTTIWSPTPHIRCQKLKIGQTIRPPRRHFVLSLKKKT